MFTGHFDMRPRHGGNDWEISDPEQSLHCNELDFSHSFHSVRNDYFILFRYFVYITTNQNKTTLYVGVTNNIQKRLSQHYFDSRHEKKSFAGKYNCFYLIYYEGYDYPQQAIYREKEIKKWRREKKERLISAFNPQWEFLNNHVW